MRLQTKINEIDGNTVSAQNPGIWWSVPLPISSLEEKDSFLLSLSAAEGRLRFCLRKRSYYLPLFLEILDF